jgi:AcrR family transcriptional regulator
MAERKRPRRTRERIVETSLAMFNRLGEPNVTTAHIADEMGISPGNLYYHFRNKDEIVGELFAAFESRLDALLDAGVSSSGVVDVEDLWLFLHLLFEAMWEHRFLYRDLDEILSRSRSLSTRFGSIMRRGTATVAALCRSMVANGTMLASEREIAAIADNVALVATFWIPYQRVAAQRPDAAVVSLDRAAYQVLSLIAPFLLGTSRDLVDRLSRDYL